MEQGNDRRSNWRSRLIWNRALLWVSGTLVVVMVAIGVVLDLRDGDRDDAGSNPRESPVPAAGAPSGAAPAAGAALPVGKDFDARRGWQFEVAADAYTSGRAGFPHTAFARRAQQVVYLDESGAVRAVSAADGREVWSWGPAGLEYAARAALVVVDTPGGEYVAVVSEQEAAPVVGAYPEPITFVDLAAVSATGPLSLARRVTVEGLGWQAVATPTGLILDSSTATSVAIDPQTGIQTPMAPRNVSCPQGTCATSPVLSTARGAVAAWTQSTGCDRYQQAGGPSCALGWEVGTAWASTAVAPAGKPVGVPLGVTDRYLVAAWQGTTNLITNPELNSAQNTVFAVHDLASGAVIAQTACRSPYTLGLYPGSAQPSTQASPGGRFLASGQVVFDLQARTGRCLTADAARLGVDIWSVDDRGTVYGTVGDTAVFGQLPVPVAPTFNPSWSVQAVRVPLGGQVELLPPGTLVPFAIAADGTGVFRTGDAVGAYGGT
ncbi:hypothetical protein [Streptodolium elevatio]|uniref:Uncharacterized protein n=1 Tax=Streptodolium elevatio TaxID=3157996 RepID=A0ABV3D8U8_9ACTN